MLQKILTSGIVAALVAGFIQMWREKKLHELKTDFDRTLLAQKHAHDKELLDLRSAVDCQLETVRLQSLKTVKVHALQFEKEFQTYEALWGAAHLVRVRVLNLMPELDNWPSDASWESVAPVRLKAAGDALDALRNVSWNNEPFVPPQIYEIYDRLQMTGISGFVFVQHLINNLNIKAMPKIFISHLADALVLHRTKLADMPIVKESERQLAGRFMNGLYQTARDKRRDREDREITIEMAEANLRQQCAQPKAASQV